MEIDVSNAKIYLDSIQLSLNKLDNVYENNEWDDAVHDSFENFLADLRKTESSLKNETNRLIQALTKANEIDVDSFSSKVETAIGGI